MFFPTSERRWIEAAQSLSEVLGRGHLVKDVVERGTLVHH